MKKWILVSICAVLMAACSTGPKVESDLGMSDAPDWVNQGTAAVDNEDGRFIHGVGSAPDLGDMSLQMATADGRARAEIARVLSSFIDYSLNDYSGSDGEQSAMEIRQEITSASKTALNGANIIGRWKDPDSGSIYAIAEIDMEKINELVQLSETLSRNFRRWYEQSASDEFERFRAEEQGE